MGSERLPGKVLKKIGDRPLLDYHIDRLEWSHSPVIVATTTADADDRIVEYCNKRSTPYFRGSEKNVLERFWGTANEFNLESIVRVTSDCPLIDGELIGDNLEQFEQLEVDYLTNTLNRTFPRGLDFEIFTREVLEDVRSRDLSEDHREHVTTYLRENLDQYSTRIVRAETDLSDFRLTVDTIEDLKLIRKLIKDHDAHQLKYPELSDLIQEQSDLFEINCDVVQKTGVHSDRKKDD